MCLAAPEGPWGSEMSGQGTTWDRLGCMPLGTGSLSRASSPAVPGCVEKLGRVRGAAREQEAGATGRTGGRPLAGLPPCFLTYCKCGTFILGAALSGEQAPGVLRCQGLCAPQPAATSAHSA